MPFSSNESIAIALSEKPFDALPQFFFWLIFLAPSFLIEQSFEAPKTTGSKATTLPSFQVTLHTIAHSGSICNFCSPWGKIMVLLLNGNTPKNLGVTASLPSFKLGIKVGKTAFGAFASLVFTFVKSTALSALWSYLLHQR